MNTEERKKRREQVVKRALSDVAKMEDDTRGLFPRLDVEGDRTQDADKVPRVNGAAKGFTLRG